MPFTVISPRVSPFRPAQHFRCDSLCAIFQGHPASSLAAPLSIERSGQFWLNYAPVLVFGWYGRRSFLQLLFRYPASHCHRQSGDSSGTLDASALLRSVCVKRRPPCPPLAAPHIISTVMALKPSSLSFLVCGEQLGGIGSSRPPREHSQLFL